MKSVNTKLALWLILSFVFAVCIFTCKDQGPTEHTESPRQIIPLAVGNHWTYVDSIFTTSGIFINTYTVSVDSVRIEGGARWWKLRNTFNPSIAANEFTVRNDSVFSRQHTRSLTGLVPILSLEYIRPLDRETSSYHALFDGDVMITKSVTRLIQAYSVAAGTYTGCLLYTYPISPERYQEVLMPGVGILSCEIRADSSGLFGPAWQRKIKLVSYALVK